MAYVPCNACGLHHKNLNTRDIVLLIAAFQDGNGQVVTKEGILSMCLLDILDLPPTVRKERENKNGRLVLSAA